MEHVSLIDRDSDYSSRNMASADNDERIVTMRETWSVLGPFPIHAREQQFLSPSFPINLSEPIDFDQTWPSSLADGGTVSWSTTTISQSGVLKVSFPAIRWDALRATEGWAVLQHHCVLRATFVVPPPVVRKTAAPVSNYLLVDLKGGSYFAVRPTHSFEELRWHAGNVYRMPNKIPVVIELPVPPLPSAPTEYELFVSGDYEIRLFGDPRASKKSDIPLLRLVVQLRVKAYSSPKLLHKGYVVPDFVDGYTFGPALGLILRNFSGWSTVDAVTLSSCHEGFTLKLQRPFHIAPAQTRTLPILISQTKPFLGVELHIDIQYSSCDFSRKVHSRTLKSVVRITRRTSTGSDSPPDEPICGTYFSTDYTPTAFVALPPKNRNLPGRDAGPPLLALHGAGVNILGDSFWAEAIPRQAHSWVVLPTGRTSWGLDWHGPSAEDAWNSLDALASIVNGDPGWYPWAFRKGARVVVLGHSNGGQGAWYLASRFPDRVLGVIAAASYIKSQAYVPWTASRFGHFIDPALRAILETSLTADDNDLFLSNLVDIPVFAIHGGADDNVPTWHTRALVDILRTWKPDNGVIYREDKNKPHWYPSVFHTADVQSFLDGIASRESETPSKSFTLTVSIPAESGSLHGWRIESLRIPGRLGRLHIAELEGIFHIKTVNVAVFSLTTDAWISELVVDDTVVPSVMDSRGRLHLDATNPAGEWRCVMYSPVYHPIQPSGRLQRILSSDGPILLVVPNLVPSSPEHSVALRISHDLRRYHCISTELISNGGAWHRATNGDLGSGNIVVVGNRCSFNRWLLANSGKKVPLKINDEHDFEIRGRKFAGKGIGVLFLLPHPQSPRGCALFLSGTDISGLERAARLFPLRTGVLLPDWLVIGPDADQVGAAAVLAAGVLGPGWEWNDCMSWI